MPWIGLLDGEKVIPEGVDDGKCVVCVDCGGDMYPRPRRDTDSKTARHFFHPGGSSGCAAVGRGGESEIHRKLKSLVVSRLRQIFDQRLSECQPERAIKAPSTSSVSKRVGDAFLEFGHWDNQLGRGVIVEVQYRNLGKDIESTTQDYLDSGYSVVWTYEDDFTEDRWLLDEVAIRTRAREAVWPQHVPPVPEWGSGLRSYTSYQKQWLREYQSSFIEKGASATLPTDWFDQQARILWEDQEWDTLFTGPSHSKFLMQTCSYPGVRMDTKVHLPPDFFDSLERQLFRETAWDELFRDAEFDLGYALDGWVVKNDVWGPTRTVPATFHLSKWLKDATSVLRVGIEQRNSMMGIKSTLDRALFRYGKNDLTREEILEWAFSTYYPNIEEIGLIANEGRSLVRLGDIVTFALVPGELYGDYDSELREYYASQNSRICPTIPGTPYADSVTPDMLNDTYPDNLQTARERLPDACAEEDHDWASTHSHWNECRNCGLSDKLLRLLGQNV